ncbi:MAG TPA: YkgJ family cysteine cluster protein [Phycisphaerae bacterium]|nr:YkgJ family cysteine cluster protein [Phycisphaerae bacterium]
MSKRCVECKAKCCTYFCFQIDTPETFEAFEDIRWYLCHDGVSVHIDEDDDWYIQITNRCNMLSDDCRCRIYDDRPLICRQYSADNCEGNPEIGEDYGYKQEFKTPGQLDRYAFRTLGRAEYENEMISHRAGHAGVAPKVMKAELLKAGMLPRKEFFDKNQARVKK